MRDQVSAEQLYCTLLYLLSRQARQPETDLSDVIGDHLRRLSNHGDTQQLSMLKTTCDRLLMHWKGERPGAGGSGLPAGAGTQMH